MSGNVLRWLNESQVRRVLAQGGRLASRDGEWWAWRSHDTRRSPAGAITPLLACRLQSEGFVCPDPDRPGRFVAAPGMKVPPVAASGLPPRCLAGAGSARPAPLREQILRSTLADAGETTRLTAAARRFTDDVRQSVRHRGGEAALARLMELEVALGLDTLRQLESLLLEDVSPAVFARCHGLDAGSESEAALSALRALASTYGLGLR